MGQRILRVEDDPRFLRGEGRYVDNLPFEGALHPTFVRSPSRTRASPAIEPRRRAREPRAPRSSPPRTSSLGVFPRRRSRDRRQDGAAVPRAATSSASSGDIVAVVVTEDRAAGVDAAELVLVDYDPLPAVVDPEEALAGRRAALPERRRRTCARASGARRPTRRSSTAATSSSPGGLVSQRLAPCPLEPRVVAAVVGDDGRLTLLAVDADAAPGPRRARAILGLDADASA